MDTASHNESTTSVHTPAHEVDPDSPEFIEACLGLIRQSAARRNRLAAWPAGAHAAGDASPDEPSASQARSGAEELRHQLGALTADHESDVAALREARRREDQVRAELETLQHDLSNFKKLYADSAAAVQAASQRASEAHDEFADAMTAISDRDAQIEKLGQVIADQDREIADLQRRLLQAEEARIADASAILDSLDRYRT